MSHDTKWSVDPAHSTIDFTIRHLMIARVRGSFKVFDASIYTKGKDFSTAQVDLWIDAASVSTGDQKRDEHLKTEDFLDTATYPQISFVSNTIAAAGDDGRHTIWGDLTIKGITKNIGMQLQFGGIQNDPWGNQKAGFSVTGKINRSDWGVVWNTAIATGGVLLGEELLISCEIELIKADKDQLTMQLGEPEPEKASL